MPAQMFKRKELLKLAFPLKKVYEDPCLLKVLICRIDKRCVKKDFFFFFLANIYRIFFTLILLFSFNSRISLLEKVE